ncbi:hypothetical protein [Flavobacterium panacagri]|uniref:hypothetical protein n=1 Tax=Flavobacterium panacagri TaxID=3034146 RepID=UPI0025A62699|nr:hypothetical protein [Flavobacterium panacagri]
MDNNVKKQVEEHILSASGLNVKSVGYKTIQKLFSIGEVIIWFNYEVAMDIRRGCIILGLEVKLKRDIICIDDDVIINYYEKVIGLKYPEQKPELTHYDRVKLIRDKHDN